MKSLPNINFRFYIIFKKKNETAASSTKLRKAGRSLHRKSVSLNAAASTEASFNPSPLQKAAQEAATAKYQKMGKEELIEECGLF